MTARKQDIDPNEEPLPIEVPVLTNDGGVIHCNWQANFVRATAKGIKQHSDALSSEVTWYTWTGDRWAILYRSQFNLLAATTRNQLAQSLTERASFGFNWKQAIDQFCILVPDEFRSGEPFVMLDDVEAPATPPFLVEKILPLNQPTVFFGDGMSGKSTTAMHLATCILTGKPVGGVYKVNQPGPVLYLDWETNSDGQAPIYKRCKAGLDIPNEERLFMHYRRLWQPLAMEVETLREYCSKYGIRLVVIDSIGPAVGGDINDAGEAMRFISAQRALNCTTLMVAHVSKADAKKGDKAKAGTTIIGSKFFELLVRHSWELRSQQNELDGTLSILMHNRKHNLVRKAEPIGMRVSWEPNGGPIRLVDVAAASQPTGPASLSHRIETVLKRGALDGYAIASAVGAEYKEVAATLSRMEARQEVRQVAARQTGAPARWGLALPGFAGEQPALAVSAPVAETAAVGAAESIPEPMAEVPEGDRCEIAGCIAAMEQFTATGTGVCATHAKDYE